MPENWIDSPLWVCTLLAVQKKHAPTPSMSGAKNEYRIAMISAYDSDGA